MLQYKRMKTKLNHISNFDIRRVYTTQSRILTLNQGFDFKRTFLLCVLKHRVNITSELTLVLALAQWSCILGKTNVFLNFNGTARTKQSSKRKGESLGHCRASVWTAMIGTLDSETAPFMSRTDGLSTYLALTVFLGRLGECQLHGATMRIVPLTHSTFVLLFVRAHLLVAAYMLWKGKKGKDSQSAPSDVQTVWDYSVGNDAMGKNTPHIWPGANWLVWVDAYWKHTQTKQECSQNAQRLAYNENMSLIYAQGEYLDNILKS